MTMAINYRNAIYDGFQFTFWIWSLTVSYYVKKLIITLGISWIKESVYVSL